ncbi:GLABROUS1 enhancer-binding protein family [Arabidopsis suecica]|uniref:Probable transcription factor At4g00232 n=2 Tax=Arabidopsis TaxID=3701 RepID=STKLL_ARATH|nr:DNA-binding storekeeper protein-related transcriptional regulator [Arabidopsis thaliana]Q3EAE7.1 RecName: Full=Probable transcription factor At4g00232; AltName: Full=Storekeeper-like protein At4g00232 [Arabidopsis thaliana]ABE65506.1 hypothetical protein At4g00232 [Arabidopsis thaliana]AEE81842.1 DNA-binding storekeeper protein-related transcriptional regulator [Arabidopsis thaliana]KAG7619098.1 GLABROUS1 enhancer-binding protein family [Arabidopsis suecica]|eukprot:NP_567157.1 DNA-binding storekeeper protein-related transcriptional regulator [Arabidopsis thaliana]
MDKANTNRSKVCGGSGEAKLTGKKRKNVSAKQSKKDAKKENSQMLKWSSKDEVLVLQGMLDFKSVTGKNPVDDINGAYEFVVHEYISTVIDEDFIEKMKSLKKKLKKKQRIYDKDPSSSEPLYQKSSEWLKMIWGYDVESALEKPRKSKRIIKL